MSDLDDNKEDSEYAKGYKAGLYNDGVWGGESEEWLEGFRDGTEQRIEEENE
jgi:hypothetical protein